MKKHNEILNKIPKEYHNLVKEYCESLPVKNDGMVNSGMYFKRDGKTFDLDKCFDDRGIKTKESALSLYQQTNITEKDIDFWAINIAKNFKTILMVALEWEKRI